MAHLVTHLGHLQDVLIEVRVRAENARGWGEYSQVNSAGILIQKVPEKVTGLYYHINETTNSAISLEWDMPVDWLAGGLGVDITSFTIMVEDVTSGTVAAAYGSAPVTSQELVSGLTGGNNYTFYIVANNIYGPGEASDSIRLQLRKTTPPIHIVARIE